MLAVAGVVPVAHPQNAAAASPVTMLFFDSPDGHVRSIRSPEEGVLEGNISPYVDDPGEGLFFMVTPTDSVEDGLSWFVEFGAPPGEVLGVGTYVATSDPYLGTGQAYFRIWGNSQSCGPSTATFDVLEASFDGDGKPVTFAARFRQYCTDVPTSGEIRYASSIPIKARDIVPYQVTIPISDVGVDSTETPLTITNTGNVELNLADATGSTPVAVETQCPVSLAPGASCELGLVATPVVGGTYATFVTVNDDAWPGAHPVRVFGAGIAATTVTLESSVNPSTYPANWTVLTATVTPTPDKGTITFAMGGGSGPMVAVNNGVATYTFNPKQGPISIVAEYSGWDYFHPSESEPLIQEAAELPNIEVWTSSVSGPPQQPVAVGAELRPAQQPTGGTLTLVDELTGETFGSVTEPTGQAIFNCLRNPIAGIHRISATYSGAGHLLPATEYIDVVVAEGAPIIPGGTFTLPLTTGAVWCASLETSEGDLVVSDPELDLRAWIAGPDPFTDIHVAMGDGAVGEDFLLVNGLTVPYDAPFAWSLVDPAHGGVDADGEIHLWFQAKSSLGIWTGPMLTVFQLDRGNPSGTITVENGATFIKSPSLSVTVPGTDPVTEISQIALSNDGTTWTTRPYAPTQAWTVNGGNGTRTVYAKWRDEAGNWSLPKADTIILDTGLPTTSGVAGSFAENTALWNGWILAAFAWSGSDSLSGVARYEVEWSTDGAAYVRLANQVKTPAMNLWLAPWHTYRIRVRAVDKAGNVGAWSYGQSSRVVPYQETHKAITWTGTWSSAAGTQYLGGSLRHASVAVASATFTFTGRSVAWVSAIGPTRGLAKVYVDGVLVDTVDLQAAAGLPRRIAFSHAWAASGAHTIKVVVVGTAGHPRVDVDGFMVGT